MKNTKSELLNIINKYHELDNEFFNSDDVIYDAFHDHNETFLQAMLAELSYTQTAEISQYIKNYATASNYTINEFIANHEEDEDFCVLSIEEIKESCKKNDGLQYEIFEFLEQKRYNEYGNDVLIAYVEYLEEYVSIAFDNFAECNANQEECHELETRLNELGKQSNLL